MLHIDMDSFGADCPRNWAEIADYLNGKIDAAIIAEYGDEGADVIENEHTYTGMQILGEIMEISNRIFSEYCNGDYSNDPDCPEYEE